MNLLKVILRVSFCLVAVSFGQEKGADEAQVDPRFEGFSHAFITWINVDETLKEVEAKHPDLGDQVKKVRKELDASAVGKGFAGMVVDMKRMMGDEFPEYEKATRKQIRDFGAGQEIDAEMAGIALENIAKIKDGKLPTEILRTAISMNPEYRKNPLKEFQDGWVAGFSTKMDAEKRRVHYLLRYPGSWLPQEGNGASELVSLSSDEGFGNANVSLQVIDAPDPKYAAMEPLALAKLLVPKGGEMIESSKVKVAGSPAGRMIYDLKIENAAKMPRVISYSLHAKKQFVTVLVTLSPQKGKSLDEEMKRLLPLFDEMAAKLEIE